jgi:hypothetical protein
MNAPDLVPWFQIASTVLTGIGIIVSTSLGIISLSNQRRDKIKKIEPNLFFRHGGYLVKCTSELGLYLPGIAEEDGKKYLETNNITHSRIIASHTFAELFNHGEGVALNVSVWFQAIQTKNNGILIKLSPQDTEKSPFNREWNITPTVATPLPAGESTKIGRLPTSIVVASPQTNYIDGVFWIECIDSLGSQYRWSQEVSFFIDRSSTIGEYSVIVSFGNRSR